MIKISDVETWLKVGGRAGWHPPEGDIFDGLEEDPEDDEDTPSGCGCPLRPSGDITRP